MSEPKLELGDKMKLETKNGIGVFHFANRVTISVPLVLMH